MSIAMVRVTKDYFGEKWDNTYCVGCTQDPATFNGSPGFTADDLALYAGGEQSYEDYNTDPSNGSYRGGASILAAIIGFERYLTDHNITFDALHISDGLYNTTAFKTYSLGYNGLNTTSAGGASYIAPGNVTLMLPRNAAGVNSKGGRAFYRGVLYDEQVDFRGYKLVGLTDAVATRQEVLTASGTGTTGSKLDLYFGAFGDGRLTRLFVPHYHKLLIEGKTHQELHTATAWVGWGNPSARSRQVMKGRKRKVGA